MDPVSQPTGISPKNCKCYTKAFGFLLFVRHGKKVIFSIVNFLPYLSEKSNETCYNALHISWSI